MVHTARERVTYQPWYHFRQSENFPWCIVFGGLANVICLIVGVWLFKNPERHQSQFFIRLTQFMTSSRFRFGILPDNLIGRKSIVCLLCIALLAFPMLVYWPILNISAHSNYLFFRCKELCW